MRMYITACTRDRQAINAELLGFEVSDTDITVLIRTALNAHCHIFYGDMEAEMPTEIAVSEAVKDHSHSITGLTADTRYRVWVKVQASGYSDVYLPGPTSSECWVIKTGLTGGKGEYLNPTIWTVE